jgi:hypothetical protein
VRSNRELGADDGADAGGKRGAVETRGAVDAITIEQCDRRVPVACRLIDERFRKGRGFQEAER